MASVADRVELGESGDCDSSSLTSADAEQDYRPKPLLQPAELLMSWLLQQSLLFVTTFYFAQAVGVGHFSGSVGTRVNVLLIFCLVSAFLYECGSIGQNFAGPRHRAIAFVAITWFSSLSWAVLQSSFKSVNLSAKSMATWPLAAWVLAIIMLLASLIACAVHCKHMQKPIWRTALLWASGFLFVVFLLVIAPANSTMHVHHWMNGAIATLFFQGGKDQPWSSICAQAIGLGVFVNGVAVFGFGPLLEGLAACNK